MSASVAITIALITTLPDAYQPSMADPSWMTRSTLDSYPANGVDAQGNNSQTSPNGATPWLLGATTLPLNDQSAQTPAFAADVYPGGSLNPPNNDNSLAGFYDPFTRQFAYGSAGVQPYRLGWYSYDDFVWMPGAHATVGGNFQNLEWNTWLRYSTVVHNSLVFSWTVALNGQFWTGPSGVNFPPDGDQLLSDFQLASNWGGKWNWQVGVTPQIDSDFNRTLNSNSLMCDVRAVAFYRPVPAWTFAIGAAYWNRASDHLIPYGGVIWAPNNRWEFRFLFPRSRISYYTGNYWGFETWGYVSGEYNLEAYQLDIQGPHISVRGELSDYRFLKGFNFERGRWNFFWEGGAVFDRHARFRGAVGDYGIHEGLMIRTGITY